MNEKEKSMHPKKQTHTKVGKITNDHKPTQPLLFQALCRISIRVSSRIKSIILISMENRGYAAEGDSVVNCFLCEAGEDELGIMPYLMREIKDLIKVVERYAGSKSFL